MAMKSIEPEAATSDLAGWFVYEENCWVATSSDWPGATKLYRAPAAQLSEIPEGLTAQPAPDDAMRKLLTEHDRSNPQPGHCYKCGLPMVENPHPDAGKPGSYLQVGVQWECLPCSISIRHGWYKETMKLRMELADLRAAGSAQQAAIGAVSDAQLAELMKMSESVSVDTLRAGLRLAISALCDIASEPMQQAGAQDADRYQYLIRELGKSISMDLGLDSIEEIDGEIDSKIAQEKAQ